MATLPPAGWYPNPDDQSQLRWWGGTAWSNEVAPPPVSPSSRPAKVRAFPSGKWRPSLSTWIVGSIALFFSLISLSSGFGGFLFTLSLFALPTAIVALAAKRPTWLRFPGGKKWPLLALAASTLAFIVGVSLVGAAAPHKTDVPQAAISLADYKGSAGTAAASKLDAAGLTVKMVTEDGTAAPTDWSGWTVVGETPAPGTSMQADGVVTITLKAPRAPAPAPKATASVTPSATPSASPSVAPVPVAAPPAPAPAAPAPAPKPAAPKPAPPAPVAPAPVAPAPAPPAAPPVATGSIIPGAFCPDASRGVVGHSAEGKAYTCGGKGPDANGHLHWNV